MKGLVSDIAVENPTALGEALDALAQAAEAGVPLRPLAGGTDIFPPLNAGVLPWKNFLNVWRVPELRGVSVDAEGATIGAAVPYAELLEDAALRQRFPNLAEASRWVGGAQIQSRGTLGGNIANASPAADAVPALMAYGAELLLASSARGERTVALADFYRGYKKSLLKPDELIVSIRLPNPPEGARHYFRKVGTRLAQAISKVVMAGVLAEDGDGLVESVAISIGSVAPVTLRAKAVEAFLLGKRADSPAVREQAAELLQDEIAPIDDIRSTAEYRRFAAGACLREFLEGEPTAALADLELAL